MSDKGGIALGLGLLSIGRVWGHVPGQPPTRQQAFDLFDYAIGAGIRFFDTAPAYGSSERVFGAYLREHPDLAEDITIATKMGEHWLEEDNSTVVDHSYDALCRSFDCSIARLGRVDVLQIHKATADIVTAPDTLRAIAYARNHGVPAFGASVSDIGTAAHAIASGHYGWLQFPYNAATAHLAPIFGMARTAGVYIAINRPYAMGRIQAEASDATGAMTQAMHFIRDQAFTGVILTGTRSAAHLAQSIAAFAQAS